MTDDFTSLDALRNLMAVINQDGGHRASSFSSDKEAAVDCEATVVALRCERNALKREIEGLKALLW